MGDATQAKPGEAQTVRTRSFPIRLLLFGLVIVVAVAFGFLAHTVNEARILVQRYGYYTMALTFAWAVVAWVRVVPGWLKSWPRFSKSEIRATLIAVVGLTLIAVLTVPYTYKVLYDEFVLQSTAWCLHELREVGATVLGYKIEGVFSTMQTYLDKRPFFFTFIVSLVHDLTGYRESNAFALNTMLMPVALGLIYLLARRFAEHRAALGALVSFGAYSLLAQNATGAGMEMLNIVMLLLVMHLAVWFLREPDEPRLAALVLGAVLLAQTRYESSLYVLPAALIILEGWRRSGKLILPAAAVLAPALLIPYALHNTYLSGTPLLWELREGEASRFGFDFFAGNLVHAFKYFFSFSGSLPNSWWLGIAGLPAAAFALAASLKGLPRWKTASAEMITMVLFGGAIAANLGLLLFYYWGNLDDPIVSRLSLPFTALLALCLAWIVERFPLPWRKKVASFVIIGALFSYVSTGLMANASHWELNIQARRIAWELEQVQAMEQKAPGERLIITNKSALFWLTHHISSIQIVRARVRGEQIRYHMGQHTFREILVMQSFQPLGEEGGFQMEPSDRLPDSFILEPVKERRFGTRLTRISRLVRVDEPKIEPSETEEMETEDSA